MNQAGTLLIADQCNRRDIHCTIFGTGCIYEYDAEHTIGGKGFLEEDPPNFDKSFYSKTKVRRTTSDVDKLSCSPFLLLLEFFTQPALYFPGNGAGTAHKLQKRPTFAG